MLSPSSVLISIPKTSRIAPARLSVCVTFDAHIAGPASFKLLLRFRPRLTQSLEDVAGERGGTMPLA
jgi:hypothetical protein